MYVFAEDEAQKGVVVARFFYLAFGAVVEDPATGSACANLGGWMQLAGKAGNGAKFSVEQGDLVGRPSRLRLSIEAAGGGWTHGAVRVGGDVVEIGRGFIDL